MDAAAASLVVVVSGIQPKDHLCDHTRSSHTGSYRFIPLLFGLLLRFFF